MMEARMSRLNAVQGFTMVELLVVITVISLLVSMMLPSMNNARELTRTLQCVANQREMLRSIQYYKNDYKLYCPAGTDGSYTSPSGAVYNTSNATGGHFMLQMQAYLIGCSTMPGVVNFKSAMAICPNETNPGFKLNYNDNRLVSYMALNRYMWDRAAARAMAGITDSPISVGEVIERTPIRDDWITRYQLSVPLSEVPLFTESNHLGQGGFTSVSGGLKDASIYSTSGNVIATDTYGNWVQNGGMRLYHNFGFGVNFAYVDGHAGNAGPVTQNFGENYGAFNYTYWN